jgi:phage recombination protein Bet
MQIQKTQALQAHQDDASWENKLDLLIKTLCNSCNEQEFDLFVQVCKRQKLDPFAKQIFAVKRGQQMTIQTSIDGYRIIAERTGRYMPGREATFTYDDKGSLTSATSYVKKMDAKGEWHETSATAYFDEYKQEFNGKLSGMWSKMPRAMLSKCAESLALRKAFPSEMGGIYTKEEMEQADVAITVEATIGEEEGRKLDEMIGDDQSYRDRILKYYQVDRFSKIKSDNLEKIKEAIRKHNELRVMEEMNTSIEVK